MAEINQDVAHQCLVNLSAREIAAICSGLNLYSHAARDGEDVTPVGIGFPGTGTIFPGVISEDEAVAVMQKFSPLLGGIMKEKKDAD